VALRGGDIRTEKLALPIDIANVVRGFAEQQFVAPLLFKICERTMLADGRWLQGRNVLL
jgi:hypothetical protein